MRYALGYLDKTKPLKIDQYTDPDLVVACHNFTDVMVASMEAGSQPPVALMLCDERPMEVGPGEGSEQLARVHGRNVANAQCVKKR
mmetsp:Transcript_31362/g.86224  ORF Transcript_31362/g.86224 Transcript_31362/m.86224 type:complete len:86 (-) Transcript_31362:29-286(-)